MNETQATIVKAYMHYGVPVAEVTPYRVTDRVTGRIVEIADFYADGCLIVARGFRIRKDGQYAAGPMQTVTTEIPDNVRVALAEVKEGK